MKTASILALAFFVLYVVNKAKPKVFISYDKQHIGLDLMLDNQNNKQGFPIGNARDFEGSIEAYRTFSKEQLVQLINEKSLNLYQVSNALVLLGNQYLQQQNVAEGLPLVKAAAYDYHNPLAMVTLARAHYHGFAIEEGEAPTKDLKEAYYLVNRAFQTADVILKKTGQKFALDKSVAMGLGLLDSYQLHEVKKEFNAQDHQEEIGDKIQADVAAFVAMYKL